MNPAHELNSEYHIAGNQHEVHPAHAGGNTIVKSILYLIAAYVLVAACAAVAAEVGPDTLVKSTTDEVLTVIKQNKDKRALRDLAAPGRKEAP